jgi:hypothetical protein
MNKIGPDCKNIIYKYIHQMSMEKVLTELKSKVIYCEDCDEFKVTLLNYKCSMCKEPLCDYCLRQEREYFEEQIYQTTHNIQDEIMCNHCYEVEDYFNEQIEDETESQIAYAEEELWRDMHGCMCSSQMY